VKRETENLKSRLDKSSAVRRFFYLKAPWWTVMWFNPLSDHEPTWLWVRVQLTDWETTKISTSKRRKSLSFCCLSPHFSKKGWKISKSSHF
jgi:hypothetical protein